MQEHLLDSDLVVSGWEEPGQRLTEIQEMGSNSVITGPSRVLFRTDKLDEFFQVCYFI